MTDTKFLLLQINDSLFPIGGYAHSYGLETYIARGLITNEPQARQYIESYIRNSMVSAELLCIRLAHERAGHMDIGGVLRLEELSAASRIPLEIRDANRKLGSRFVKTLLSSGAETGDGLFTRYAEAGGPKTHAVAYGVFCASAEMEAADCLKHFLYSQISCLITNCVKSVPLPQTAGQRMLTGLFPVMNEAVAQSLTLGEDDLFRSCPAFDIRSMQHEVLYSRIFMS